MLDAPLSVRLAEPRSVTVVPTSFFLSSQLSRSFFFFIVSAACSSRRASDRRSRSYLASSCLSTQSEFMSSSCLRCLFIVSEPRRRRRSYFVLPLFSIQSEFMPSPWFSAVCSLVRASERHSRSYLVLSSSQLSRSLYLLLVSPLSVHRLRASGVTVVPTSFFSSSQLSRSFAICLQSVRSTEPQSVTVVPTSFF